MTGLDLKLGDFEKSIPKHPVYYVGPEGCRPFGPAKISGFKAAIVESIIEGQSEIACLYHECHYRDGSVVHIPVESVQTDELMCLSQIEDKEASLRQMADRMAKR